VAAEQLGVLASAARDEGVDVHVEPAHAFGEEKWHPFLPVGQNVESDRLAAFKDARDRLIDKSDNLRMLRLPWETRRERVRSAQEAESYSNAARDEPNGPRYNISENLDSFHTDLVAATLLG
jgi:hypothetical protein